MGGASVSPTASLPAIGASREDRPGSSARRAEVLWLGSSRGCYRLASLL
jgi:hypothetical protein